MKFVTVSISPVQPFIAQSRKTSDLWTGSWLLSYLAGIGLEYASQNGDIIIPHVRGNQFYDYLINGGKIPHFGSLPNTFTIKVEGDGGKIAKNTVKTIRDEWQRIADMVWAQYLDHAGEQTKQIWDDQIKNFWNISWVVYDNTTNPLGMLKSWREFSSGNYRGDPCTLMNDMIEISGYIRSKNRKAQDVFWSKVRNKLPDLKDNERLSAVGLVKRAFPKIVTKFLPEGNNTDKPSFMRWASVVDIAVKPWLNHVKDHLEPLVTILKDIPGTKVKNGYLGFNYDSQYLYTSKVEGTDDMEFPNDEIKETYLKSLKDIQRQYGSPSPFYSILIMDGDRIGELLRDLNKEADQSTKLKNIKKLSCVLGKFTSEVEKIIKKYDGVLVYAGGDDVLALMPLTTVIPAAMDIEKEYEKKMKELSKEKTYTMSAGVVFSNFTDPLRAALEEAHHLIDDIAKERNGRGSIAISTLKRQGRTSLYYSTWEGVRDTKWNDEGFIRDILKEKKISSSFIYRISELITRLVDEGDRVPGTLYELDIDGDSLKKLLRWELSSNRENGTERDEMDNTVVDFIYNLLLHHGRSDGQASKFLSDGLYLLRFLSQNYTGGNVQ